MGNRPQTHGEPEQVGHPLLGGPLRQAIRPRAQRHDGLDAWPKPSWWDPARQVRSGRHPTRRAEQPVQLILRHYRPDRGHLGHLMAVRLRILAWQGVLTPATLPGLDRDHGIHLFDGYERPALPRMARLAPALASTGPTAWTLRYRLRGITRRRPRGVVRVLVQAFQQLLHSDFKRGDACFEGTDILTNGKGRLLQWC
jgi:hypothetical protein